MKHQDVMVWNSKKVKGALLQFIAVSLSTSDPVDSFREVAKEVMRRL